MHLIERCLPLVLPRNVILLQHFITQFPLCYLSIALLITNLDIWRSKNLSLFGRVLITKSLGIPHLIYSMSMLVTPSEIVSSVTTSLFDFIWCKKRTKLKGKFCIKTTLMEDFVCQIWK